jgi:HK97 family phage portal protein
MSMRSLLGGIVADAPAVPYVSRWRNALGRAQQSGSRGREGQLALYSDSGTLYGVVSKLASSTSLVNWRLYRSAASGLEEDRTEVTRHAALMVLNKPNQFMTRQELIESGQQHLDLAGEAWWVIVRTGKIPFELWPVRPDRMTPIESNTEFIAGYVYRSPDGEEVPLAREDVIMVRTPSPLDIYRGLSPLPALDDDLDNDRAQGQWSAAFFQNNANPGGVISVDRRLGEDDWEEMVTRWGAQHRGISNAGRVAVLEQATFTPISYTQRDMQFVESRNLTKQSILDAYGFPKFGLGDVDDVNRASAEASLALIAQTLTVPRLERWKGALNNDFLPQFGTTATGLEFDYDSPVPPDQELDNATLTAKVQAVVALVTAGFDADEACDTCDLPRMLFTEKAPEVIRVPSQLGGGGAPEPALEPA